MSRFVPAIKIEPGKKTDTRILLHFGGASGSTVFINETGTNPVPSSTQCWIAPGYGIGNGPSAYWNSGAMLTIPYSTGLAAGTGNMNLEFTLNAPTQPAPLPVVVDNSNGGSYTTGLYFYISTLATSLTLRELSTGVRELASTMNPNITYHFQLIKNSTTVTLYRNGVSVGTYGTTGSFGSTRVVLGGAGSQFYTGYIGEFKYDVGGGPYYARVPRKPYY